MSVTAAERRGLWGPVKSPDERFQVWWRTRTGDWISPQGFRRVTGGDGTSVLKGWERRPPGQGWLWVKGPSRADPRETAGRVVVSTCHDQPMTWAEQARFRGCRLWAGNNVEGPARDGVVALPCGVAPNGSTEWKASMVERALSAPGFPRRRGGALACWDDHGGWERKALKAQVASWATVPGPLSVAAYVQALRSHRWVLSPAGYGWDCYRTWEALASGAWVVVQRSGLDRSVYEELPVWVVDDWHEVTPLALAAQAEVFAALDWGYDQLTVPWWVRWIRQRAEES